MSNHCQPQQCRYHPSPGICQKNRALNGACTMATHRTSAWCHSFHIKITPPRGEQVSWCKCLATKFEREREIISWKGHLVTYLFQECWMLADLRFGHLENHSFPFSTVVPPKNIMHTPRILPECSWPQKRVLIQLSWSVHGVVLAMTSESIANSSHLERAAQY